MMPKTYSSAESESKVITNGVKVKAQKCINAFRKEHLLQKQWNSLAISVQH